MSEPAHRDVYLPYGFDPPGVGLAYDAGFAAGLIGIDAAAASSSGSGPTRDESKAWVHGFDVGSALRVAAWPADRGTVKMG